MSYLSDWLSKKKSGAEALAKSIEYARERFGLSVTDAQADAAKKACDELVDDIERLIVVFIKLWAPKLPLVVATTTAAIVGSVLQTAIAGATNVVKANN